MGSLEAVAGRIYEDVSEPVGTKSCRGAGVSYDDAAEVPVEWCGGSPPLQFWFRPLPPRYGG